MEGTFNQTGLRYPGCVDEEGTVQLLLVCPMQQSLENLQKSLYITRKTQEKKRNYNLNVHICKSIADIIDLTHNNFQMDYIVFIVDVLNYKCLEELESQLSLLKPTFRSEKICLVAPNLLYGQPGVQPEELWEFVLRHQLNLLNGKILDDEKLVLLATKILNLMEVSCGFTNGIPLVGRV